MRFPNAFKGVSKIFTAEILALIGAVVGGIASGSLLSAGASVLGEDITGAAVGGTLFLVFGLGAVVLGVISTIFKLIGCNAAGKDDEMFKKGFIALIISLIAGVVSGFFTTNSPTVAKILEIVGNVADLCATLLIILGIINLAQQLGRDDLVKKGNTLLKVILVIYAIAIVVKIIAAISSSDVMTTISGILGIAAAVLGIIQIIIYLGLLKKAKDMLAEN